MKHLLTGPQLPAAPDIAVPWDIGYFIEQLGPQLPPGSAEFLAALVAGINDLANLPALDRFPAWRDQPSIPLDAP